MAAKKKTPIKKEKKKPIKVAKKKAVGTKTAPTPRPKKAKSKTNMHPRDNPAAYPEPKGGRGKNRNRTTAKVTAADNPYRKQNTVRVYVEQLFRENPAITTAEMIKVVKAKKPKSKINANSIAYYASVMRKEPFNINIPKKDTVLGGVRIAGESVTKTSTPKAKKSNSTGNGKTASKKKKAKTPKKQKPVTKKKSPVRPKKSKKTDVSKLVCSPKKKSKLVLPKKK